MSSATVDLLALLSCCCDAAERATSAIREAHVARLTGGDAALEKELKDPDCDRSWATVADLRAQLVITTLLRREFGSDLSIIGEEDESEAAKCADAVEGLISSEAAPLNRTHPSVASIKPPARWVTVPRDQLCLYIDPVDGTKEFVEGRVQNSCCLIGISLRGEAVAGVIGMPFWRASETTGLLEIFDGRVSSGAANDTTVDSQNFSTLCGIVDGTGGVGGLPPKEAARVEELRTSRRNAGASLRLASSADGAAGSPLQSARAALCDAAVNWEPFELVPTGATANKILAVIRGDCDAALMNLKCSLWDSCATEAVLVAMGGAMTDFFGGRLYHHPSNPLGTGNKYGMLASAPGVDHARLWKRLSATPAVTSVVEKSTGLRWIGESCNGLASDIARDIRGAPLTVATLASALNAPVASFCAPEDSAVRYKMAECVRLVLEYSSDDDEAQQESDHRLRSVFIKRSVMRDLKHARNKVFTVPHKLARDVRSYAVETAFLRSHACALLSSSPSRSPATSHQTQPFYLARALHSEAHVDEQSLVDSAFLVVLEDFTQVNGWHQRGFVSPDELRVALKSLARFHAHFWNGRIGSTPPPADASAETAPMFAELEAATWDSGCYWSPKRQAADQIDKLAERFALHGYVESFGDLVEARGGDRAELARVPERLTQLARQVARASHLYLRDDSSTPTASFEDAPAGGPAPFEQAASPASTSDRATQSARSRAHSFRTLIHGDLKAANLFFRANEKSSSGVEAGFIDYQWTGWGLGAVDIAYMFAAAAGPECFDLSVGADAETGFLRVYHDALRSALEEFGVEADSLPFDVLKRQYENALLDHSVTVFSYLWNDIKASPAALDARGKKFALTANAVNKNAECGAWLLGRVARILEARCNAA